MYDLSCRLLSANSYISDSVGNQILVENEVEIPIIKVENVRQNEFYSANEQGLKPSLRLKISSLNYNGEKKLIYMGQTYSVIRTDTPNYDEIVLVCERKEGNF
jgi:SPP1 family predicted phage head-tail adaptor